MEDRSATLLSRANSWGAGHAAVAVVGPEGPRASHGDATHAFAWASVTKLVTAWAVLVAVDRGLISLDEPAGPSGSTVRHLLAHASGLPFDGAAAIAAPGRTRIYSNPAYDRLGALLAERLDTPIERAIASTVTGPLGMSTAVLIDRPSMGLQGSLTDLVALARELLRPTLVARDTAAAATTVAFPGLRGVVPGVGPYDPCDWGLGPEIHDGKERHWMGATNSPETFGHFGGTGTFLWVDPIADVALCVLSDRGFGSWALEAWPTLSDEVLAAGR